jgi:hypothetical protein
MRKTVGVLVTASVMATAAAFALAAQSASPSSANKPSVNKPSVNDSMTKVMSTNAQTIWDISSKAFNARGDGLVAAKVSAKDWAQLGDAARAMNARALYLAKDPKSLVVAKPEEQVLGEEASRGGVKKTYDAANRQQIKGLINANPALFTKRANILARAMADLAAASKTRNIKVFYRVSSNLDEYCDGCHQPFWGTDDNPPVTAAMRAMKPVGR